MDTMIKICFGSEVMFSLCSVYSYSNFWHHNSLESSGYCLLLAFIFRNSAFCSYNVYLWVPLIPRINSVHFHKQLIQFMFVNEIQYILCVVGTEFLILFNGLQALLGDSTNYFMNTQASEQCSFYGYLPSSEFIARPLAWHVPPVSSSLFVTC